MPRPNRYGTTLDSGKHRITLVRPSEAPSQRHNRYQKAECQRCAFRYSESSRLVIPSLESTIREAFYV